MFGLNMYRCAVRDINSHAEAVAFYKSCPIKGGHDYGDERPIKGKESSKQMGVRIPKNGDVVFRYHSVDVVTWRADNSYVIETYASRSTCAFANCFLPREHWLTKEGAHLGIGSWSEGTVYPVVRRVTVRGDHVETDGIFTREVVDRKGAKEVLAETRYAEYRDWYNVMFPMIRDTFAPSWQDKWWAPAELMEMLNDPDQWHAIMTGLHGSPKDVREVLYSNSWDQAYTTVQAATLPASKANNTWRSALA
jgi:hypothetical protein